MSTATRAFLSLAVLALLALALQSLVFSGASFTRGSADPGTIFTAGSLSHTDTAAGILMDAAGLLPGQSKTGTFTVTGGGSLPGTYTLAEDSLVDTPSGSGVSSALTLTVADVTGASRTIYDGTVAGFTQAGMGTIGPGESRTYQVTLAFPAASATPALSGASMTLGLRVTGVS